MIKSVWYHKQSVDKLWVDKRKLYNINNDLFKVMQISKLNGTEKHKRNT